MLLNKLLLLTITFCISLSVRSQKYEYQYALDFLKTKGIPTAGLTLARKTKDYVLFSSSRKNTFVLVATEKYEDVLPNRILAYSDESNMDHIDFDESGMISSMLSYYTNVLHYLLNDSTSRVYKKPESFVGEKQLKTVVLGQRKVDFLDIYERGIGVAGCVPTSATQIMFYHKWPDVAHGKYMYYRETEKSVKRIDIEGLTFSWPENLNMYNGTTRRLVVPNRFLAINGLLFEANFGFQSTSADMSFCKRAFVYHYKYSRKAVHHWDRDELGMLSLTRREIDAGRPVMVGRWRHAFICDGYTDDYFHFNMGWYGSCDGYYRLFPYLGRISEYDVWEMISGITPERNDTLTSKTITLKEAGTLSEYITAEDYNTLGKLKVVGPINGKDIKMLRQLSGGADVDVPFEERGVLSELDLSEAHIVESKDVYYSFYEHNVTHNKFVEKNTWNDSWMEEIVPDKVYMSFYHTNKDKIGTNMFTGCDGLERLVVPKDVTSFGWYALSECVMLREFVIPKSVKTVKPNVFAKCKMLEKLSYSKDAPFLSKDPDGKRSHPFTTLYPYTEIEERP